MVFCRCSRMLYGFSRVSGSVVLVPVGSFEDHFDEPMVLDTLLALEASCRVAEKCGWLVAWPLGYGFSPGHRYSVSLDEDLDARLVLHVADSLRRLGARRIVVVDGHYGHSVGLGSVLRSRGHDYINVWSVLEGLGYSDFEKQVLFEKLFSRYLQRGRGDAATVLEMLAEELARLLECNPLGDKG